MGSIGDPSTTLSTAASFSSIGRRYTVSTCNSEHLLAYLRRESTRSITSLEPTLELEEPQRENASPSESAPCDDIWWSNFVDSAFIDSTPFALRPASSHDPVSDNAPTPTASHFHSTHTKHKPPPLKLLPLGESRLNSVLRSPDNNNTPTTLHAPEYAFDLPSPWFLLDAFPSPPSTPPTLRRSKTNISLSKILRRGGNSSPGVSIPDSPKYWPKEREEKGENVPYSKPSRHGKKGRASLGSLSKAFRIAADPVPSTPPLPVSRRRSKSISSNPTAESRPLTNWNGRDSIASKLFALASSPKSEARRMQERRVPGRPKALYIPRSDIRIASCPIGGAVTLDREAQPGTPRSRSVSQPNQSKLRRKKPEEGVHELKDSLILAEIETPLAVPPRRTHSPSYINLYVPPWRQTTLSPTQASFSAIGALVSASTTPIDAMFGAPEMMYLPASESTRSVKAEVDPFGAGEPSSFFRFEYKDDWSGSDNVGRATMSFYEIIGAEVRVRKRKSRRPNRQVIKPHTVPEIVVSSSGGLKETMKKNWVLAC